MTKKNPTWTRDETIIALDIYFLMKERGISSSRIPEIKDATRTINHLHKFIYKNIVQRTEDSVYLKILNIASLDKDNMIKGQSNGSKLDKEIWNEFQKNKRAVTKRVEELKSMISLARLEYNAVTTINLPELKFSNRDREYKQYSDVIKAKVLYEHLFNNRTHRWLDIHILGRNGQTNGRVSANILYYLGLKAEFRGIFEGYSLNMVIEFLKAKENDFGEIVRLLKLFGEKDIYVSNQTEKDLEALIVEEGSGVEGYQVGYYVNRYERDPKNRAKAIEIHGLTCFGCGFNFESVYGKRGKGYIEIHHTKPLSQLDKPMEIKPETDLIPLCANCHRIVHRSQHDVLSLEDLKKLLN